MRLKVLTPIEVLIDEPVTKVIAEAENGSFCLLPRHIDFVAALVPGILYFMPEGDREAYCAIDHGTLVKCGDEVMVSTMNGVRGDDLESLQNTVEDNFLNLDDLERHARTALARLEAGTIRRFIELEEQLRGER